MSPLTYRELLQRLHELTDNQLDCSVCVGLGDDEYVDIYGTILSDHLDDDSIALDIVGEDQPLLLTFNCVI